LDLLEGATPQKKIERYARIGFPKWWISAWIEEKGRLKQKKKTRAGKPLEKSCSKGMFDCYV